MATVNLGAIRFNWKGAYNNSTAYVVNDVVSSSGNSYVCIQASQGNAVGNATAYWNIMSSAGTNGTNGTDVGTTITTQGDILYRDGSGLQRLAKGTASQELRMNSGATAPEWYTPAAASTDVERIASGAHSGTELIVDNCFTTAYELYELHFYNIQCSAYHRLNFRSGGGSGTNLSGSDYRYHTRYWIRNSGGTSDTGENSWSDTSFRLAYSGTGTGNYGHHQILHISEPTANKRTGFIGFRNQLDSGATGHAQSGGYHNSNTVVTGFRFTSNSGSSFIVDYAIYGKKIS